VVGSELIGQPFTGAQYFHGRPSATGYNGAASAASNKGPTDLKLADTLIAQAVDSAMKLDGVARGKVPADLATGSGSGLDPHISPAAAELQVARVARVRGISESTVRETLARFTEGRTFGLLGEPRVNVLLLNLALDSLSQTRR
jgi:K+-transporting ATPase ATPase C chain